MGNRLKLRGALICVFVLGGCANLDHSSQELRADPHQKGSVNFADPYPTIFANISTSANKCFPTRNLGGPAAGEMAVKSIELEPGKLARVEGMTLSFGGQDVFLSIDIRAIPNGTVVDYYISAAFFGRFDNSSSFAPVVNLWARGDARKCD
jgi:hypothetical protein